MADNDTIIKREAPILITGAAGFIGSRVVHSLIGFGYTNLRCFVRPSSDRTGLEELRCDAEAEVSIEVFRGNLLSPKDCMAATKDVEVVYHLAAGTGEKSYPDAFMNSVVTTRNLLDACMQQGGLRRFVNVSSLAVYSNRNKPSANLLDESAPVEERPELRGEAYCYVKLRQDQFVRDFCNQHGIEYVVVRPGVVYGRGRKKINGRVGLGTFGVFLHLGGRNTIPFTYVDNCADAIVLSGIKSGISGEVFNVVDDDLPSSTEFLRRYKREVTPFASIYLPKSVSYLLCYLWEKYSRWSYEQLPPVFNRLAWHAYWKGSNYSNEKIKNRLGWRQKVPTATALKLLFESCRELPYNA